MPSTYTNVAKPTSSVYSNQNPVGKEQFDDSNITYDSSTVFYDGVNQTAFSSLAKPVLGPAVLVQSATGYTGSTPLNISYSSKVTKGNLLVVCVSNDVSPSSITITDDQNHTWTRAIHLDTTSLPAFVSASIYYTIANGNTTPTITLSDYDIGGSIYEYSGVTNVIDNSNSVILSSASTSPTANSLTTTTKTLIIAMAAQEQTVGTFSTSGGGFTLQNNNGAHVDGAADYQNAPAGSYAAVFNFNSSKKWIILQVAFKVGQTWTNITKPT